MRIDLAAGLCNCFHEKALRLMHNLFNGIKQSAPLLFCFKTKNLHCPHTAGPLCLFVKSFIKKLQGAVYKRGTRRYRALSFIFQPAINLYRRLKGCLPIIGAFI